MTDTLVCWASVCNGNSVGRRHIAMLSGGGEAKTLTEYVMESASSAECWRQQMDWGWMGKWALLAAWFCVGWDLMGWIAVPSPSIQTDEQE